MKKQTIPLKQTSVMRGAMTLLVVLSLLFTPVIPARSNVLQQKPHTEWRIVEVVQSQESFSAISKGAFKGWSYIALCSLCLSVLLNNRMKQLYWGFVRYKSLFLMQVLSFRVCIPLAVQSVH